MASRKKVLVVDDERSIGTYLTTVLDDHGYAALSALDAAEGLALARAELPDLICMDVMMPKRSGIAFYQDIKRDPLLTHVPVIFISAFNLVRDLRQDAAFRKMVPDEAIPRPELCMEKPIRVDDFLDAVESIVGGADGAGKGGRGSTA